MKVAMVIPSYWGRERRIGWKEGDAIYDHPTPLDEEGTLLRALESIHILNDRDFLLVVIAVATAHDIADKVEKKVRKIVKSANLDIDTIVFCASHLRKIHDLMHSDGINTEMLDLRGYSNIRNLCVFIPHVFGRDVAVLIDDDEVFEDADFMAKATEFIGRRIDSLSEGKGKGQSGEMDERVLAVAGFYVNEEGSYLVKKETRPWMKWWNQYECMNRAFEKIIGNPPRLKETPFVFGGNMVIHRDLWMKIPFDPNVPRGEDIDYLINARMFGFRFFLDNKLSIKHLPPPKVHPLWLQLRMDICRFVYERAKIEHQMLDKMNIDKMNVTDVVSAEDFDPYPGCFLKHDLHDRIVHACRLLSEEYMKEGDQKGAEEALRNIRTARECAPKYNVYQWFCNIRRSWEEMMIWAERRSSEIQELIQ